MLEFRLLGQFLISLNGAQVELPSRPAQSLLAFLILSPGVAHRRERLAGLLWPDITEEDARRNLRRALWHIRKSLQGQAPINADHMTISFVPSAGVWADVQVLEQALPGDPALEALIAAVSAYGGELLPGFYDEWTILERERLQVIFEQRMKQLIDQLVAEENWLQALHWGERWTLLGGAPEPAFQALMKAYAALNDQSGVARSYQRCVETLERELGVEPSQQTRKLYVELTAARSAPVDVAAPAARPPTDAVTTPAAATAPVVVTGPDASVLPASTQTPETASLDENPPYKGLQYFNEEDADLFFGREALIANLTHRLGFTGAQNLPSGGILFIVGASGSGKSSLARAGLLPAIRAALRSSAQAGDSVDLGWKIVTMTPTSHPLEALAAGLSGPVPSVIPSAALADDMLRDARSLRLALQRSAKHTLILVDQLEELFTLCRDENERRATIDNLLAAVEGGGCTLILTLRADFYNHCAGYADLRSALAANQEFIGPMSLAELRRVVEEPARQAGVFFEGGLIDLILREAGGEPGTLPLLSHALLETWKRRQGDTLALAGYAAAGGVHGALARTAENVYGHLTPDQQRLARNIFLRLVEPGEGVQDTRRRASPAELSPLPEDKTQVEQVLHILADARLLTIDQRHVEIAHEALIHAWPELRAWLAEDRDGLRLHRRLSEAAQSWQELDCETGELYRAARLAQALEWATGHTAELNEVERDFLTASQAFAEREAAEREAARSLALETAGLFAAAQLQRAEEQARSARIFRWLAIGLAFLFLAAFLLAGLALQQRQRVASQARLATSRELAASALANLASDPERSILLSLQALETVYTPQAEEALRQSLQNSNLLRIYNSANRHVFSAVASVDGKVAASSSNPDGSAITEVWEKNSGKLLFTLPGALAANFWPDLSRLATVDFDNQGLARYNLWDAQDGRAIAQVRLDYRKGEGGAGNLSPDWRQMAVPMADGVINVYDLSDGSQRLTIGRPGEAPGQRVAFSADGKRLVASLGHITRLYDLSDGRALAVLPSVEYGAGPLAFGFHNQIAIGTGAAIALVDGLTGDLRFKLYGRIGYPLGIDIDLVGSMIAAGGSDNRAVVWDVRTGQELYTLDGHQAPVQSVAFVPWQNQLVTAADDGTVRLWDITVGGYREAAAFGSHYYTYSDIAYSPDGLHIVVSGGVQPGNIFDAESGKSLLTLPGMFGIRQGSIAYNPAGDRIALADGEQDVTIWEASTGKKLLVLDSGESRIGDLAYSPDGARLAALAYTGELIQWDTGSGERLVSYRAFDAPVTSIDRIALAYSPDGGRIATAGSRQVRIWDAHSGVEILSLPVQDAAVYALAFSPDGRRLAIGGLGAAASLWDARTGGKLLDLAGHQGSVQAIVFSKDGEQVITGGADGAVKLWDAESGDLLLNLTRQPAQVTAFALRPDGARLAVSSDDGVARVYYLRLDDLVQSAESRLSRWFTAEECQKYLHREACPAQPGAN